MPRSLNPGTLATGGGLAASKSVEASSFVHPTQGLDGLIAHIVDPSRAHMARAIGIEDVGNYYASDHVEGALQEIGSSLSSSGSHGVVTGGGFTAAGLIVTLDTPTTIRLGTDHDFSGQTETLTNNAINWLYVNPAGNLTHTTGASPPSFAAPENVLLWRIVTAGGIITQQTDARFFVPNIDRKVPFTVRSQGTATNRNAEGCFESLEAALLYLQHFAGGAIQKTRLIIRGQHTLSTTTFLPIGDIIFDGEDGAEFVTGATLTPMFDLNGHAGVQFRNIRFTSDHSGSVAIQSTVGGGTGLLVERCTFTGGVDEWDRAVNIQGPTSCERFVMRDCDVNVRDIGVRVTRPVQCKVIDTEFTDVTGTSGTAGISLGVPAVPLTTEGLSEIRGCTTEGFASGIMIRGVKQKVVGCNVIDAVIGITVLDGADDATIENCAIELHPSSGLHGVTSGTGLRVTIRGCRILNPRSSSSYTTEVPSGVIIAAGADGAVVSGCRIEGFLNTVTPGGFGVVFQGTSNDSLVQGCTIDTTDIGFFAAGTTNRCRVAGCDINEVRIGLSIQGNTVVGDNGIRLSSTRAMIGIDVLGGNVQISNCRIQNPRLAASYGGGENPYGIQLNGVQKVSISNVDILGFYNSAGNNGYCIVGNGPTNNISIEGGILDGAYQGISLAAGTGCRISGTGIQDVETGIRVAGTRNTITGCNINVSSTRGREGVLIEGADTLVTGCQIICPRTVFAGETPVGVNINAQYAKVTNCIIRGWRNASGGFGYGVAGFGGAGRFTVTANTIETCWNGIHATGAAAADNVLIADNEVRAIDVDGILVDNANNAKILGNTLDNAGTANGIYVARCVDLEILGNKVFGNSDTDTGIGVEGADTASDRLRRFVIANNNIREVTGIGISLKDYVQNGIVQGNQVDCFLPGAPADPTAVACIKLECTTSGAIPKNVVISNNHCARAKNGIVAFGLDIANPIDHITISGNTIHHCAEGAVGAVTSVGVDLFWVSNASVIGNDIFKMGVLINNADVESAPTAGPNVNPRGVRMRNCTRIEVCDNSISDILRAGTGLSSGIQLSNRDTGSAFDARSIIINGNRLTTSDAATTLSIGIEVTTGQQTSGTGASTSIFGLNIEGNTVRRVRWEGILVFAAGGSTVQQVVIANNSVSQTNDASFGFGIWIGTSASAAFGGGILREVDITGNNLGDLGTSGIYASNDNLCTMSAVSIKGNTVADAGRQGIEIRAAGPLTTQFQNFTISENTISGAALQGIRVRSIDIDLSDVTVSNNVVTGADGGEATGEGIEIIAEASPTESGTAAAGSSTTITLAGSASATDDFYNGWEVTITSGTGSGQTRTISDYVGSTKVATVSSAWTTPPNATSTYSLLRTAVATRWVVSGNRILGDGTSPGIKITSEGVLQGLSATGNDVTLNLTGTENALLVECVPSAALPTERFAGNWNVSGNRFHGGYGVYYDIANGPKLWNTNFSSNIVTKSGDNGLKLDIVDATAGILGAVVAFTVDGNTFENGGVLNSQAAVRLWFGDNTTAIDAVADVKVTNNRMTLINNTSGNPSRAIYVRFNAVCLGLDVSGNTLDTCGNAGSAASEGIIQVELGQAASQLSSRNVSICRNKFINNIGGFGILVQKYSAAASATIRGLRIAENEIVGITPLFALTFSADAIRVDLTGFEVDSVSVMPGDIDINGNNIARIGSGTLTHSDVGIVFIGPATATLENVSICRNKLSNTGNGDGTTLGAIYLDINDPVENLSVEQNEINLSLTGGIYLNASTTATNLSISQNKLWDTASDAIYLDLNGATENMVVAGNLVEDATGAGIEFAGPTSAITDRLAIRDNFFNTVGSGALGTIYLDIPDDIYNLTIEGNTFKDSLATTGDIFVEVDGVLVNGVFNGNNSYNPTGSGIRIHATGADSTSSLTGVTVVGNTVNESNTSGIMCEVSSSTSAASIEGLSISGNTVDTTGGQNIGISTNSTCVGRTISITGNVCRDATSEGIGIARGTGEMEGLSITGNSVYSPGDSGIEVNSLGGELRAATIADNDVFLPATYGIAIIQAALFFLSGSLGSVSVTGNAVRGWGQSAHSTYYGGIYLACDGAQNITVANNALRTNQEYAIGYHFRISGVVRTFNVIGNVTHHENAANTESMRFDTQTSGNQLNMAFVGNSFRGSRSGISINSSSFSPERSTVVGNNERTHNGTLETGGTWATFITHFTLSSSTANQD